MSSNINSSYFLKWTNGSKLLYFKLCPQTVFLVIIYQVISSNGPMVESYFKLFPQTWLLSWGKEPRVVTKCSSAEQIFTMDWVITELVLATQKQVFENEQCFFLFFFCFFYFFIALRTMLDRTGCRLPCEHISLLPFILKDHVSIRLKRLCLLPFHHKQYFLRWTLGVQCQRKSPRWNYE